jgi:broad specificity phosphatase PhoE
VKALSEIDMGLWGGLRGDDLHERFSKAWRQWRDDPASVTPPGGEPAREAEVRIFAAMAKAFEKGNGKTIGVVLRPIAHALATCWLRREARTEAASRLHDDEPVVRVSLPRKGLETLTSGLKAGA